MELLQRYLQAVKFWLPSAQQEDIIAELRDDIGSEIEERQRALGRDLTGSELEALLKERGRPLLVAENYLPQKSLIGPVLFPVYSFVLKLVLACYIVPWIAVWAGLMILDESYRAQHWCIGIVQDASTLWIIAITTFALVTVVFTVLERVKDQSWLTENWSPSHLAPVRDVQQISRFGSAMELVFGIAFLSIWWLKMLPPAFESPGVMISFLQGTRGVLFVTFMWCFLLLGCASIALSALNLVRPYWTRFRRGIRAGLNFAAAAVLMLLAKTGAGVVVSGSAVPADKAPAISHYMSLSLGMAFAIAAIVCVVVGCVDLWRMRRPGMHAMRHGLAF